jgi:hypothetical protein
MYVQVAHYRLGTDSRLALPSWHLPGRSSSRASRESSAGRVRRSEPARTRALQRLEL